MAHVDRAGEIFNSAKGPPAALHLERSPRRAYLALGGACPRLDATKQRVDRDEQVVVTSKGSAAQRAGTSD